MKFKTVTVLFWMSKINVTKVFRKTKFRGVFTNFKCFISQLYKTGFLYFFVPLFLFVESFILMLNNQKYPFRNSTGTNKGIMTLMINARKRFE